MSGLAFPFSSTLSITVIVHSVESIKEDRWLSSFFFLLCEGEMHTIVCLVRNWRKIPREEIKESFPGQWTGALLKGARRTLWKCLVLFNYCCSYCFLFHTTLNSESMTHNINKCAHWGTLKNRSVRTTFFTYLAGPLWSLSLRCYSHFKLHDPWRPPNGFPLSFSVDFSSYHYNTHTVSQMDSLAIQSYLYSKFKLLLGNLFVYLQNSSVKSCLIFIKYFYFLRPILTSNSWI